MARDPHEIKDRQIGRVIRQQEQWQKEGVRQAPPSVREAEEQVVRVAEQSQRERSRRGR